MGITNKAKPWFDDTDPSKPYYGKLSDSEIEFVKNQAHRIIENPISKMKL